MFNGPEGERLGQLAVTPEVVSSTINNMKEKKSSGGDGIYTKRQNETVEQMCTPFAHVFNMALVAGGNCTFRMERSNHNSFVKKCSRNKYVNYRPMSLTSLMCKSFETIIRDHNLWWTFS